jgi:light-regulated signal transduction histidine kinase (bacteriophytochrome)
MRQAEEDLKSLVDKLARSNRDLQRFAYVASHDLQEPLRQVTSFATLLENRYGGQLSEEARELMEYVVDGASRMQTLILDLLAYSRVDSADQKLVPASLQSVLDQALHNLRLSIQENEATVTWDELPVVTADPGQLVQLFQNLIGNAIKFRDEKPPVIHIGVQRMEHEWPLWVKDNGIGFEQQYADKIFQVFQRLHGRGAFSGTGIGLSICKRVVERHGGRIWAESEPGKGATFFFTLPARSEKLSGIS